MFQDIFEKPIQKPGVIPARSYANVGRPELSYEEKGPKARKIESLKVLKNAPSDSPCAIYNAARMKAKQEGHKDAEFLLSKIAENPIEWGSKIRKALEASESPGNNPSVCLNF